MLRTVRRPRRPLTPPGPGGGGGPGGPPPGGGGGGGGPPPGGGGGGGGPPPGGGGGGGGPPPGGAGGPPLSVGLSSEVAAQVSLAGKIFSYGDWLHGLILQNLDLSSHFLLLEVFHLHELYVQHPNLLRVHLWQPCTMFKVVQAN